MNQLTQSWSLIASARISARRVFEILDTEAEFQDGTLTLTPQDARAAIEWRGVTFRYRAETPVLRSIDVRVEPGMKVAIVGPTGAGKSTLLSMLPRFLEPSSGSVTIGGVDVHGFILKSLRSQIAMVLQPPLIFPISVRDNLTYGRPGATQREIEAAARLASIDQLIQSLPQGYDTVIGEAGATLSEGEKQRLTIARALLRDAPILILDEPTSALDVETEARVMDGIKALTVGRTTFIIAHRLSTIRSCDLILVLRDGIIAEQGNFNALLRRKEVFAELYNTQFREDDSPAPAARGPRARRNSGQYRARLHPNSPIEGLLSNDAFGGMTGVRRQQRMAVVDRTVDLSGRAGNCAETNDAEPEVDRCRLRHDEYRRCYCRGWRGGTGDYVSR